MHRIALFVSLLLLACDGTTIDRPDATLAWASRLPPLTPPDAGIAFVTNSGQDTLSVIDLAAQRTLETPRIGIDPLAQEGPHHMAIDPVAGRLFVEFTYPPPGTPSGPHAGHGTSTVPGWVQSLSTDDLHELARTEVDANPGDIAMTPDGTRVIVSHFNLAEATSTLAAGGSLHDAYANLWILDATDLHRIASFPICVMAHGVEVSPDGTRVYVACNGQDALAIVHLDEPGLPVEPLIPVGPGAGVVPTTVYGPYGVIVTDDGRFVVISDQEGRDLRVFDVGAHAFLPHGIRTGSAMFFGEESEDGNELYFPGQSPAVLVRVRRSDWTIDAAAAIAATDCLYPHDVQRAPDGRYYLLCEAVGTDTDRTQPSRLDLFDPETLAITGHYDVGVYPHDMVFLPAR